MVNYVGRSVNTWRKLVRNQKIDTLLAMYRSVERMNRHILNNNNSGAESEAHLQKNLRKDFLYVKNIGDKNESNK